MKSDFKFSHPSIDVYSNFDLFDIRFLDEKTHQILMWKTDVEPREVMEIFMKVLRISSAHSCHNWRKNAAIASKEVDYPDDETATTSSATSSTTSSTTTTSSSTKTKTKKSEENEAKGEKVKDDKMVWTLGQDCRVLHEGIEREACIVKIITDPQHFDTNWINYKKKCKTSFYLIQIK